MYYSWAEINLNALRDNIATVRAALPSHCKLLLPLKANAYGHGLEAIAKAAHEFGVDWLGLATLREALEIKAYVPEANILILGPSEPDDVKALYVHRIRPIIVDLNNAHEMNDAARRLHVRLPVHLKIDTGMGRIGFDAEHGLDDILAAARLSNLEIEGVMSHYATADEDDLNYAIGQHDRFKRVIKHLRDHGIEVPLKHISNSGGFMNIAHSDYDMVRPGILLYGAYPSADGRVRKAIHCKPLLSWKTQVTFIKEVRPGQAIGYGAAYRVPKRTKIATIEVGYGDGYRRILSGRAHVLIRGMRYPVVGRISMDQTTVDIGLVNDVMVGDEVVLLGRQLDDEITVFELARQMETIPYEVYTSISARVERRYFFNGQLVHHFVFSNFALMARTILH
ncbi:MAG: alanine racemase [bacterium]|nr:alanine racemase [bacterium]